MLSTPGRTHPHLEQLLARAAWHYGEASVAQLAEDLDLPTRRVRDQVRELRATGEVLEPGYRLTPRAVVAVDGRIEELVRVGGLVVLVDDLMHQSSTERHRALVVAVCRVGHASRATLAHMTGEPADVGHAWKRALAQLVDEAVLLPHAAVVPARWYAAELCRRRGA